MEQKKQAIEKLKIENENLKVKNEKLRGDVIPVHMIKNLFAAFCKSNTVEFKNAAEKMVARIAKKYSIPNKDVADINKDFISDINIAINNSFEITKGDITLIVSDYSGKRQRGEHD
jgi:hypothetical protein